ncbi:flagellar assembly peptidoglycan hydrolase FlgJ [Thalassotalea profundi]|uniref:Peptidoglycan hydrolase FlgJ n=1 Tax=Thalassotalea profundi TaxID=2036687 RepID=A0ABQ3IEW2_9GAMM|nr:flagellar assembly peptidoglycan hydrolase FlgJ [Thalassotalea profundi]GHE81054.1 peptidoglycan hydrolase FlgJ [Thalassotalea profundi]
MSTRIADAQNFLDVNGLNNIRQQSKTSDKAGKEEALKSAAKQFEAIFMQMLLKSMRSAQDVLESDSPFNSESTKFYRDMHDQQMALDMSDNGSLGLSELIVRQLGGDSDNFTPQSVLRYDTTPAELEAMKTKLLERAKERQTNDNSLNPSFILKQRTPAIESQSFSEPQDFVSAMIEPAKEAQEKLKVPFEVIIAQAALETGWGKKIIKNSNGESSNNLFNIKADKRWSGDKTHKETLEYENGAMVKKREPFRMYESLQDSVNDYINFLSSGERYQDALKQAGNVEQFLQGLQGAGYATDPEYANKILGTLRTVTSLISK